jgi:hypothetical protein
VAAHWRDRLLTARMELVLAGLLAVCLLRQEMRGGAAGGGASAAGGGGGGGVGCGGMACAGMIGRPHSAHSKQLHGSDECSPAAPTLCYCMRWQQQGGICTCPKT